MTVQLANELKGEGFTFIAMHPGESLQATAACPLHGCPQSADHGPDPAPDQTSLPNPDKSYNLQPDTALPLTPVVRPCQPRARALHCGVEVAPQ